MADVQITTGDALSLLTARRVNLAAQREFPFPVAYVLSKFDKKLPVEMEAYEKARVAKCEELCERDDAGKPKTNGQGYVFPEGATATLDAFLAPLHAEVLTITNVRKIKPSELGEMKLSKIETDGLLPIMDDSGEEPHA